MSQVETSLGGNPLRTINAASGPEPYTLPALASGRSLTIRREDSGTSGYPVVISVPAGHYLDDVLNGTVSLSGNVEAIFRAVNPGIWESYGTSAGGGSLTGTGGGSVTSTAQVAADSALTGTFAPGGTAGNVGLAQVGPAVGSDAWLKLHAAGNLDALISGAITRDSNGAATGASVIWPDGTVGVYAATTVSSAFPGAVDAYTVTYVGGTTKTVTQSAVTRDGTSGAVTTRPAMSVA